MDEIQTTLSFYEQFGIEAESVSNSADDSTYDVQTDGSATDYGTC